MSPRATPDLITRYEAAQRTYEIRRREEQADARKTATVIATTLALAAFAFVAWLVFMARG